MAQRIMDKADGGQILVGETVFQALSPRERYMSCFQRFDTKDKHGKPFSVYQYRSTAPGLNIETPAAFVVPAAAKPKLTKFVAYYIAIAATHRDFLLRCDPDSNRDEAATVLIAFMAEDCIEQAQTPAHESPHTITWKAGEESFEAQYKHYEDADFFLTTRLADCIQTRQLRDYRDCFESGWMGRTYAFVNETGLQRLREEWPKIAEQFQL